MSQTASAAPEKSSTLRRLLVVGCGGSGAKTLALMMDQLRSDLAAQGIDKLPHGWQFVVIDNRVSLESLRNLPNVEQQGGSFVGLGVQSGQYAQLDGVVFNKLAEYNGLDELATWAPSRPETVKVPIATGAGQYRVIGRMMTVAQLERIRDGLDGAWQRIQSHEAHSSMYQLGALGGYNTTDIPLVLVVSSMAGGSGASMALDVCRVLSMLPNVPAATIGVFMAGADVFDQVEGQRAGIRSNALAMLGEIVSTQLGVATEADRRLYRAAGLDGGVEGVPFARVFPVGRKVGVQQSVFGAGMMDDVYRGLARGLAALVQSPSAISQFESHDITNTSGLTPVDGSLFGWGEAASALDWGSFGYATLSMGRERYAHYAAQRLARGAVDHLLDGHMENANREDTGEVALRRLADLQWKEVEAGLNLWSLESGAPFKSWFPQRLWADHEVSALAGSLAESRLRESLPAPDNHVAAQWRAEASGRITASAPVIANDASSRAQRWAWDYHHRLANDFVRVVEDALAAYGLAYAQEVCRRVRSAVERMAEEAATLARKELPATPGLPPKAAQLLDAIKGTITNGGPVFEAVAEGVRNWTRGRLYGESFRLLVTIWPDFVESVIVPMQDALLEKSRLLQAERSQTRGVAGLAMLHSTAYVDWPAAADELVDRRFDQATNEVLLTSSQDFQAQFEGDVRRTSGAEGDAVREVIKGEWPTGDGTPPPRGLITGTAWSSRAFLRDLESGAQLLPRRGTFQVHVTPAEVLDRAGAYVRNPKSSFESFTSQSLRSYVTDPNVDQLVQRQRRREIVTKFREALTFALPLAAPNAAVVQKLYGRPVEYFYKFSGVPFQGNSLAEDLKAVLEGDHTISHGSGTYLEEALNSSDHARRIDIFGSYPNYQPICFDSLLVPIRKEWSKLSAAERASFWRDRRTRPLAGCLPCGDAERRAMVAGWFIGQIVGKLAIATPELPGDEEAVRVYDSRKSEWVSFPEPRLTPYEAMRSRSDWLPSVLESLLLAIMNTSSSEPFASFRPFQALRGLYDSNPKGPSNHLTLAAEVELASWLAGRSTPGESQIPTSEETTLEERVSLVEAFLAARRASMARLQAPIPDRVAASKAPVIRDLVPDILWALDAIETLLPAAARRAATLRVEPRIDPWEDDTPPYPGPQDEGELI